LSGAGATAPRLRQLVHGRQIACRAYRREDGCWEIEGRLRDVRTHAVRLPEGAVPAGEPYRELALTLIVDDALTIRAARIDAATPAPEVRARLSAACRAVISWQISPGFADDTKAFFARAADCAHLAELFAALVATGRETIPTPRPTPRKRPADQ
jgi:hypothetical protein